MRYNFFLYSVCFHLLPTDDSWDNILIFSYQVIALAYCFGKIATVTAIIDATSLLLGAMDNSILHAPGHSPEDKI